MKLLLSTAFLFLFIVGVNAQQVSPNQVGLLNAKKQPVKVQNSQIVNTKNFTKSLFSNQFISKAGGTCVDTLFYPYLKESVNAQVNSTSPTFYYSEISDSSAYYGVPDLIGQVYKTGPTAMKIDGVYAYIGKGDNQVGQTVQVKMAIYNVVAGAPTTEIASTIYTFTNETLEFKSIPFSTPVSVSSDFAVVMSVITPNKVAKVLISDDNYDATLDEGLSYFNVPNFIDDLVQVYDTYDTYLSQQVDYDFILAPMISYDVDMTLTTTPNPVCLGDNVTLTGTVTPTGVENRFMNWMTFLDYFSFSPGATAYASAPLGLTDLSIILDGNNVTHTYSTSGVYDAYMEFESGLAASCYSNNTSLVTVNTPPDATFSYAETNYCQSSAAATPTITTTGGTFSVTPTSGLSINTTTGVIDFTTSTPGSYTVQYIATNGACSDTKTANVVVTAPLNAAFSYPNASYCSNDLTSPQVILGSSATAGTFSASPAGLSINTTTGAINIAASTAGNYTVTNTVNAAGGCTADTKTFAVEIKSTPSATFAYTNTSFCQTSPSETPVPTITGGTYSVTPATGLSINLTTGAIDFSSSTLGDYTVQYVVANGACSDTKTTNVKVVSTLDASFSYANSDYCVNDVTPVSVALGANASAGTFSASPAGLSINATTGEIDLASSTVGSYTVTNTVNGTGGCAGDAKTFGVEIKAIPDAAFTYTNTNYCQASPSATPTPTTTGGTYSITPATGLSIDATTGVIDFTSSTIGNYTVQYVVTNGTCSDTKTTNVNVISGSDASFSYANSSYCTTGATSAPVVLGASASAGTFSASPAGLTINATTGEIDLASSTVGSYTVTNTVNGTGGCAGDTKTFAVSINAGPDATITPVSAVCENDNVINLSAATTGGTFSGNGVANGLFNPATAGSGLHTITYDVTVSGCTSSATTVIQVDALPPSVAFTMPSTTCKNDSPIALTGTPSGGIFTGAGVSGTTFDPSVAGVGSHAIVYTVSSGVCNASKTNTIVVDSCLAIDNADMIQVKLFPIPAENELTIFVNADVEVQVLSIDGKLLIAPFKVANEVSYVLNTQSLARGMYLLKLTTDNGFEKTQRIMLK